MVKKGKIYIIIVAAGTGNRFGGNLPKQFALLSGRPVLMHSIEAFKHLGVITEISLVLNEAELDRWESLCSQYSFETPKVVFGGSSRTESVRNALMSIKEYSANDLILIHDGARPLVNENTINAVISKLREEGVEAVIPSIPITDSLMTADYSDSRSVERSKYVAVQTPQGFSARTLIESYKCMGTDSMTDDASVVSRYGGARIHLVDGAQSNIKITYPSDIRIAELYLEEKN